jgi:hypothetical protein
MTRACLRLTRSGVGRTVATITAGAVLTIGVSGCQAGVDSSPQYRTDIRVCDQDPVWSAKVMCWGTAQHHEYQRRQEAER